MGPVYLSSLFDLIRLDRSGCTDQETSKFHDKALDLIMDKVIKQLSKGMTGYYYDRADAQASNNALVGLYERMFDTCTSIGQGHLIRQKLLEATRDPNWSSSTPLVRIVTKQAGKDAAEGLANAWDTWMPPSSQQMTFAGILAKRAAFDALEPQLPGSVIESFRDWVAEYLSKMLPSVHTYTTKDMQSLVALIPSIPRDDYLRM